MHLKPPSQRLSESIHATIYLLRHGAVDLPENEKRYIGWQDVALSDHGLQQACAWGDRFAGTDMEAIYCSTLTRCLETARIIADRCGHRPLALAELREINLGSWEGRRIETIKTLYPQAYRQRGDQIADYRPPEGESFRDLQRRVWPAFKAVTRGLRGQTLIVTHAGVIRVLLCRLLKIPLKHLFRIGQTFGTLTTVTIGPHGYCVQAVNLPCHDTTMGDNPVLCQG
jgi:probable phosphoglycerate mutase